MCRSLVLIPLLHTNLTNMEITSATAKSESKLVLGLAIDCIDYVTEIGNVIQAPGHSVVRANTFSMGSCWAWQQLKMANF